MTKEQNYRDYSNANRKIKRSVALHKFKEEGYSRICSKPIVGSKDNMSMGMKAPRTDGKKGKSWFSDMWRKV